MLWVSKHIFNFLATTVTIAPAITGLTVLQNIEKYDGEITGRFIVQLNDGVSQSTILRQLKANSITHTWDMLNGFAAHLDVDAINLLRASPDVKSISEDGIMHIMTTQTNAPWGISRLSSTTKLINQDTSARNYSFTFDSSAGAGVDIYIIDTGVFTSHSQFSGRARWGATFGGYADADGNGHGTHCAGTAAGTQFGVAKNANIIAVKVLSDDGSGSIADIISGANFVASSARASGRPSVACMFLNGNASSGIDNIVASLTSIGVPVVVPAGNSNIDAISTSPARAPSAVTVGASTIADARASFSNFGSVVDIFAPGENITSAWIHSTIATQTISGTSMATAHIVGLIAYLLGLNPNPIPGGISNFIKSTSLKNALSDIPSGTLNDLAHLSPS